MGCRKAPTTVLLQQNTTLTDSAADQWDMAVTPETLWRAYHTELVQFLTKGNNVEAAQKFSGLQLVTTPFAAEWDTNDQIFQTLVNRRTSFQIGYDSSSILGSFDRNYCDDFVYSLDFGTGLNPQAEQAVQDLYKKQDALTEEILREEMKCEDRYAALSPFLKNRYSSYDQYARTSCTLLNQKMAEESVVRGKIELLWNQFAGGRKEVEARSSLLKCRANPTRKFFELNPLKDFVKNVQAGKMNPFSITLTQSSTSMRAQSSFSQTGFSIYFISFNMARMMKSLSTTMRQLSLSISAKSYTAIHVAPEPAWFNGDVLSVWRNGPFKNGKSTGTFFGPSGSLSLLPRTYYVVYQPTIEFSLNDQDKNEFEKQSSFSFSFTYYLSFSFSQARRSYQYRENEKLWRIRIEDTSSTPQVIAVNNIVL